MNLAVLAEFVREADLVKALHEAPDRGQTVLDAYAPYPVSAAFPEDDAPPARVRAAATLAGLLSAVGFYGLEWWTAVHAYPFDAGGRPANSWPAFLLAPFELGVFVAGLAGFIAFLVLCRLPRLHHPLFEAPSFEHATQDRFFLALAMNDQAQDFALQAGAVAIAVAEIEP